MGGQLSVPSRCTAVYTWLLTASVTSGRGDPALLSWVDPVLGNLGKPWFTFIDWHWQYWNCQMLANQPCVSQVWQTSKPENGLLHFALAGWVVPTHPICSSDCKVCQEQHDDQTVYTTALPLWIALSGCCLMYMQLVQLVIKFGDCWWTPIGPMTLYVELLDVVRPISWSAHAEYECTKISICSACSRKHRCLTTICWMGFSAMVEGKSTHPPQWLGFVYV